MPKEVVLLEQALVLALLMRQVNHVVGRNILLDYLFGRDAEQNSAALDVYVHRLRQLLASARAKISIHTVHSVGYMMTGTRTPGGSSWALVTQPPTRSSST